MKRRSCRSRAEPIALIYSFELWHLAKQNQSQKRFRILVSPAKQMLGKFGEACRSDQMGHP